MCCLLVPTDCPGHRPPLHTHLHRQLHECVSSVSCENHFFLLWKNFVKMPPQCQSNSVVGCHARTHSSSEGAISSSKCVVCYIMLVSVPHRIERRFSLQAHLPAGPSPSVCSCPFPLARMHCSALNYCRSEGGVRQRKLKATACYSLAPCGDRQRHN